MYACDKNESTLKDNPVKNDFQVTIIGAGVIGLAIAYKLSGHFERIAVIERRMRFGEETSSRNSEVIHSGIYYPTNSFKAKFCVTGRDLLYELCDRESIPYKKCGKLIVATSKEEVSQLNALDKKAQANGVDNLVFMNQTEFQKLEPQVDGVMALYSPSTGIIDSHSLMYFFEKHCRKLGIDFVYSSQVTDITRGSTGYEIKVNDRANDEFDFTSSIVINASGLESDTIAGMVGIEDPKYKIHFCKGDYFSVNPPKNKLVNRLIYPVPFKKLVGLGVHATIDLGGGLRLGPNATYLPEKEYNYRVDESKAGEFLDSARRFLPFLELEDLNPDYAGIRPKIQAPGDPIKDFIVCNETQRGFKNFINLIGIESPGLTSCLAIANYVYNIIE